MNWVKGGVCQRHGITTLEETGGKRILTLISVTGKHGSVIYLNNYLSVMFNISDVMIDKEEIAMKMQLPIHVPEEITIEDSASVRFQKLSQTHKSPLQKMIPAFQIHT